MARTAVEPTARNSDCQFCSVVCQKSALPRYCSQFSVCSWCSIWSALYALQPVTDCANQETTQIAPTTISSECRYSDCQFSITACPNSDETTERENDSVWSV